MQAGSERVERSRGRELAVVIGLLVAVLAGIAAGGLTSVTGQTTAYALSSIGWVVATSLLAFRLSERGELSAAAGFALLTVAETLLWVSGRPGDPGYETGFAGGAMFYVPGVLLVAFSAFYPLLVRGLGVLAGGAWAVATVGFLRGSGLAHDDVISVAGYVLISAFFLGVAWATFRERGRVVIAGARAAGAALE